MNYETAWDRLLVSLRSWADAREVTDGIEVSFTRGAERRTVEIVMTPSGWDERAEVIGRESPDSIKRRLLALDDDTSFLVCDSGVELIASSTRDLPGDELADLDPEPGGQWVVTDEAGKVVSRFADWAVEDR